jgi:hypothetical protein
MQEILDIITFKTMISKQMLFIFYYIGAILVPILIYKYTKSIYTPLKNNAPKIFVLFLSMFIFMEILWRMMFEFLIAFLQIRDALVG